MEPSTLLCDENNVLLCDENYGFFFGNIDIDDHYHDDHKHINHSHYNALGLDPLIQFPSISDKDFASLLDKETGFFPKQDYLNRLKFGDLDLDSRKNAIDWIFKVHSYYNFGPLSLCLAVNYLDRFLSTCDLLRDQAWALQLLAVACLSIAAKMEETAVPILLELQVGDPKYVFEAKTIERMELLVLDTLNWKMNAVTPCSYLEYFFEKLSDGDIILSFDSIARHAMNRALQLILCTIKGIDFLECKPSEIAAAVVMFVSAETLATDSGMDKAISCFIHLEKERVLKCVEMIKGISMPLSPNGVLESACFSYRSANTTSQMSSNNITSTSSSTISRSPEAKRQKLN